jgi:hypothetical protein
MSRTRGSTKPYIAMVSTVIEYMPWKGREGREHRRQGVGLFPPRVSPPGPLIHIARLPVTAHQRLHGLPVQCGGGGGRAPLACGTMLWRDSSPAQPSPGAWHTLESPVHPQVRDQGPGVGADRGERADGRHLNPCPRPLLRALRA